MRQSELFTKTRKETPTGEVSKNADLLIRAGYIDKLQSGVYSYLPLGYRVLKNIENIIRQEMNKAGGQEVLLPSLHPKENWEKTGRWQSMDDLYKVTDSSGREVALAGTHEEVIVPLVKQFVSSYRDLPVSVYQFQNKFRMEKRAKSGILRGREFIMKDFYSFHRSEDDLTMYYDIMKNAYREVFKRVGIGHKTFLTYASGGTFSQYSHEFQTLTPAGEDTIYICDRCSIAINKEIKTEQPRCPECGAETFKEETSIEVGNIFLLRRKFSDAFGLSFKDEAGDLQPVLMGCYGIGLGRLMGTIVEVLSDMNGIVWPEGVAPFKVHLVALGGKKTEPVTTAAESLYRDLRNQGIEVLYDDRDVSTGIKLSDADLLGIPYRVIVSEKTIGADSAEVKIRSSGDIRMVSLASLASQFSV